MRILTVKLQYFKESGKWGYDGAIAHVPADQPLYKIWDMVRTLIEEGKPPGLREGTMWKGYVTVDAPGHRHEHSHLMIFKEPSLATARAEGIMEVGLHYESCAEGEGMPDFEWCLGVAGFCRRLAGEADPLDPSVTWSQLQQVVDLHENPCPDKNVPGPEGAR